MRTLLILLALCMPGNAAELLEQSAPATIKMGPFTDDAGAAQTGLTLSQADFRLSKNGGNMAQKNESSSATHDEIGVYDVALDATDTNQLGILRIDVQESGTLPVWKEFMVVPANVYRSLVAGSDYLLADATPTPEVTVDAESLLAALGLNEDNLSERLDELATFNQMQSAMNVLDTTLDLIVADTNELQTDWVNGGRLDLLLDTTVSQTASVPTAAGIADAVWDELTSGHLTAGSYSVLLSQIDGNVSDIETDTDTITTNTAASAIRSAVGLAAANLDTQLDGLEPGVSQSRVNKPAGRAYQLEISSMADGTYKATKPIRLRPGAVAGDGIAVDISMKPQFGETFVETVGTPSVSAGSLTCAASGPRDQVAQVIIDGTATASEERTITVPVTMETGEVVSVTFDVKVFAD